MLPNIQNTKKALQENVNSAIRNTWKCVVQIWITIIRMLERDINQFLLPETERKLAWKSNDSFSINPRTLYLSPCQKRGGSEITRQPPHAQKFHMDFAQGMDKNQCVCQSEVLFWISFDRKLIPGLILPIGFITVKGPFFFKPTKLRSKELRKSDQGNL